MEMVVFLEQVMITKTYSLTSGDVKALLLKRVVPGQKDVQGAAQEMFWRR